MTQTDYLVKRLFDLLLSTIGIIICGWIILIAWLIASIDTKGNGFFLQTRVGQYGKLFTVIKIKTMGNEQDSNSTVTTSNDLRITKFGKIFRRSKIDELPQLVNIFLGDMSFVGPRPDVPGYADLLKGDDRIVLSLKPGITGPATLKYRDEEALLASKKNPEKYNHEVIYPDKVKINKKYIINYSLLNDVHYIFKTIFH
jgi:lipopolysaccharide/colanic/teichoic acid biosynthesis glycosyltransferase